MQEVRKGKERGKEIWLSRSGPIVGGGYVLFSSFLIMLSCIPYKNSFFRSAIQLGLTANGRGFSPAA
jgi:hypothetical protein